MLLLGLTACTLLLTPACGKKSRDPAASRSVHCTACGKTSVLPSGYLAGLGEDAYRMLENGDRVFKCPLCGDVEARPQPPSSGPVEAP